MLCAKETVEEALISLLRTGETGGKQLRADLKNRGLSVSSQSVYKALKKLISEEVVLKNGTIYGLNYVWLKRLQQLAKPSQETSQNFSLFNPNDLSEGERDVYYFNNLNRAGAFWMHVHQLLLDTLQPKQIAVLYSTNEWTSIVRRREDDEWAQTASQSDNLTLFAIGEDNYHNRLYKKEHFGGNLQISVGKNYGFPVGYYLNVFNDYIVELVLPNLVEEKLSEIFAKPIDDKNLDAMLGEAGVYGCKVKLVVKKNKKLAQKLSKRISKDFYLPETSL
jgi:hypothetical protein